MDFKLVFIQFQLWFYNSNMGLLFCLRIVIFIKVLNSNTELKL